MTELIQRMYAKYTAWRAVPPRDSDEGSVTLEQVLWTLGLLLAAAAAVTVVTLAITNRTGKIK
jgi:hypothetical protein